MLYFKKLALKHGDLDRLLVPTDSNGRKCGVDNGVIDKPYLVFFNLEKCIDPTVPLYGCQTPQVCVEKCPDQPFIFNEYTCNGNTLNNIREQLICTKDVDKQNDIKSCGDIIGLIHREQCARWYMPSKPCKFFLLNFFKFLFFKCFVCYVQFKC